MQALISCIECLPPPSPPPTEDEAVHWQSLFLEVPQTDLERIEKKVHQVTASSMNKIGQVASALRKCDWKDPIFDDQDVSYYLLALFKSQSITQSVLATAMCFIYASDLYGKDSVEVAPLFLNGTINREALKFIDFSLKTGFTSLYGKISPDSHMDEGEKLEMYNLMLDAHPCERVIFITPDKEGIIDLSIELGKRTITQEIHCRVGVNVFGRLIDKRRILASTHLFEAFLEAKFGKEGMIETLYLFATPSSKLMHEKQIGNVRLETIPAPRLGLTLYPAKVDNFDAPGLDPTEHDRYHRYRCSCVFKEHRPFITALGIQYKEEIKKRSLRSFARILAHKLFDLEMNYYDNSKKTKLSAEAVSQTFWNSIGTTIEKIVERAAEKFKEPLRKERSQHDLRCLAEVIARTFAIYQFEIKATFLISAVLPNREYNILDIPLIKTIQDYFNEYSRTIKASPADTRSLIERIKSPRWENKN